MAFPKVNRFTFDKHSVVLFSAMVLAGAGSSASAGTSRVATSAASMSGGNVAASTLQQAMQRAPSSGVRSLVLVANADQEKSSQD